MKKLKIAYFGTPYFSAIFLEKLMLDASINRLIEVKLVVTQPDKPVGRKQIMTKSPVKVVAEKYGIKVYDKDVNNLKLKIKNFDLAFLYSFGPPYIPKDLLNVPKYGFLNTHPSLLPKYRGPSPTVYPFILGDKKTGVTLIRLDEKVDHGQIIAQKEIEILHSYKRPDLEARLTDLAFIMFKKQISTALPHRIPEKSWLQQNHASATFTRKLTKEDGFIDLAILKAAINNQPSNIHWIPKIISDYYRQNAKVQQSEIYSLTSTIYNLFSGLYPWPGIWTKVRIKEKDLRLKLTDADLIGNKLIIKKVQLEGKKEVDFQTFVRAYRIF